jgi:TonB dependent receptor
MCAIGGSFRWLAIAICTASWGSVVAHAQTIEPPHVLSLPELTIPEGVALPANGLVEATIGVDADGHASLETCLAPAEICALVRDAIAQARFEPARRDGEPIAARVRIALRVAEPAQPAAANEAGSAAPSVAASPAAGAESGTPSPAAASAPAPSSDAVNPEADGSPPQAATRLGPRGDYGAQAHVQQSHQPGMRRLELAEMRDLPGAFGDPFRAVEALPGIVPVLSGLPYFFVRGSPPAGTLYFYDDIPVPTLYHLAVGPAVIHPRMVGPIRLYSGVAPARYGRLTGGVVVGEGPASADGETHAETELRLLDVSGYLQTQGLGGDVTAAVRYGYPALLLTIFSPDVSLAYWDYQLRYAAKLSAIDRFELVALGSYDSFGVADEPDQAVSITFHRMEPRLIRRAGKEEFGGALLFGWEQSALGSGFQLQASRLAPRLWFEHRFTSRSRLRLSADMQGVSGHFSSTGGEDLAEASRNSLLGDVPARSVWGVQGELTLRPWTALEVQFGARGDAWVQGSGVEAVLDPRLRVIVHASEEFDVHVAAGVVHQPAVFFIPLPGIADLANDRGLQTALQSEAGVGWDTPLDLRAEIQFFLHGYENLVFTDTLFLGDSLDEICNNIDCMGATVPSRIDGLSYGLEVFLKRPITEALSGFVSYTVAWSAIDQIAGLPYTPTWDVRHVANVVLQWQIGAGFSAGLRWFFRSGKVQGDFSVGDRLQLARDETRLPGFSRLDLEVAYAWKTFWGRMRVALEWFNATLTREPQDLLCEGVPRSCRVRYLPAIFFPNLSFRGEH